MTYWSDNATISTVVKPDRALTLAEAARQSQLSPTYLRRLAATGRLDAEKYGKTWVVRVTELESFTAVERRRGRPSGPNKEGQS